mgnify:CR=1 FL=1
MKTINFSILSDNASTSAVDNTKVNATFVQALKEAFLMFPAKTDMRFKQSYGQLIISVTVTYRTGIVQHFEGAGDTDLISAIHKGMAKIIDDLSAYKAEEHEVEIANDGENLVLELFKQYIQSSMRGYIETDWYSNKGERYRCMRFTSTFNGNVRFCLKATDEVNGLINEACKPQWMKEAEVKQEATESNKVA